VTVGYKWLMLERSRLTLLASVLALATACVSGCGGGSGSSGKPEETDSGAAGDSTSPAADTGTSMDSTSPADSVVASPDSDLTAGDSSLDTGPTEGDSGPADSGSDTGVAETGPADSGVADTGAADSTVADTGPLDTGVADTATSDTGAADSSPVDAAADAADAASDAHEAGIPEAGGDAASDAAPTYTVSFVVSGLAGGDTLAVKDNGGDTQFVTANGTFTFATALASGASYAITIGGNPTAPVSEACAVANGSGVIGSANVGGATITCSANTFAVGGTVVGAPGGTVVLQDNGGDNLSLTGAGAFAFPHLLTSGATYTVTVLTQPSSVVTCTPSNATGTVGTSAVSTVTITCATNVTGMIGYWNFNEASGTTAADSSGNNLTGVLEGAVAFTPGAGKQGTGAITFSGGYVDVSFPNNELGQGTGVFMPQGNITYVMWVKTQASTIQGLQMIDGNTWGGGCDRVVGNASGGVLNYEAWSEINFLGSALVNDGNYHQVVYVLDETNGFVGYVDGAVDAVDPAPGGATGNCGVGCSGFNWASDYWIGTGGNCRGNVGNAFTGLIDDVRIYNRPLPASDVASLYQATK